MHNSSTLDEGVRCISGPYYFFVQETFGSAQPAQPHMAALQMSGKSIFSHLSFGTHKAGSRSTVRKPPEKKERGVDRPDPAPGGGYWQAQKRGLRRFLVLPSLKTQAGGRPQPTWERSAPLCLPPASPGCIWAQHCSDAADSGSGIPRDAWTHFQSNLRKRFIYLFIFFFF